MIDKINIIVDFINSKIVDIVDDDCDDFFFDLLLLLYFVLPIDDKSFGFNSNLNICLFTKVRIVSPIIIPYIIGDEHNFPMAFKSLLLK